MKFRSLYKSRTENLGVTMKPAELKKILNENPERFHFIWMTENSFIISLNFSYGSNLLFDINRPNTKSEIIFYGKLTEIENSKTKIELKTRSKTFLATLLIVLPLLVVFLQIIIKFEWPIFLIQFAIFPLAIIGLLNFIRSEEDGLLRIFKEYLNDEIIKHDKNVAGKLL
ncbi:hypothetical protein [Salinimicrobium sp. TH3]|uniref:hypothetical protein n=1 Tax=Salinimicrobium sp. TH3 TaxID=2997342 RepID=UPI0022725838|nr:hypothetical protein [Salinimicrobium sp. TH3]MCY2685604.1 hypothetical protein [Salinimicrobium sp. TH3]